MRSFLLWMESGILSPAQQIVDGNMKVIGKGDEGLVIGLPFFVFVAADGVLVHIQVKCQFYLRDAPLFAQFF